MREFIDREKLKCEVRRKYSELATRIEINHMINEQPIADVRENKRGKWINGMCDQCGEHALFWAMASTYYQSNFCPHCGADMRGEKDDTFEQEK